MKSYISILYILCSAIIFLYGCNDHQQFPEKSLLMYGDAQHTNYYEELRDIQQPIYEKIPMADTSGCTVPPLCVSSYQTILATRNSRIVKVTAYQVEWQAQLDDSALVSGAMMCDNQQSLYACTTDGHVYCFDKNGNRKWKKRITTTSKKIFWENIIPYDNGIIVTHHQGEIYFVASDNGDVFRLYTTSHTLVGSPVVHENIIIAGITTYGEGTDSLLIYSMTDKKAERIALASHTITAAPIIAQSHIAIGVTQNRDGKDIPSIILMDKKGNTVHTAIPEATPRHISTNPEGDIFTVSYNIGIGEPISVVESFSFQGKKRWQMSFRFPISQPLYIGETIRAFIAQRGNAIGCYVLDDKGTLIRLIQVDEAPNIIQAAFVSPGGSLVIAPAEGNILTRITAQKGLF